jgi:hypothetical protein
MLDAGILRTTAAQLAQSGYDVAAGISEETLNDFLRAHWHSEESTSTSVYKGSGRSDELALTWSYHVAAPAKLALAPLSQAQFTTIYRNWLRTIPEISRHLLNAPAGDDNIFGTIPPPNVQVLASPIHLELKTDSGIDVPLDVSLVITGFVQTTDDHGTRVLRITPIDARISNQGAVRAELNRLLPAQTGNDPNCIALEKLIFYIANVVLANRVGAFVREFGLPVPIRLINSVTLVDIGLSVVEKHVVLLGHVGSEVNAAVVAPELAEMREPNSESLRHGTTEHNGAPNPYSLHQDEVLPISKVSTSNQWPSRGIFLIFHQRFFQAIVSKIGVDQRRDKCESWKIFKICWGYFLRLWGLVATVTDAGLNVHGSFDGGGYGKACIETHCGDACVGLSAKAQAKPDVAAQFSFQQSELWMAASPNLFPVTWTVGGLPWPFGPVAGWFLDVLTGLVQLFLAAIGYQFRKKLTTLPTDFPGTTLAYTPSFDPSILKMPDIPALAVLGEIHFR